MVLTESCRHLHGPETPGRRDHGSWVPRTLQRLGPEGLAALLDLVEDGDPTIRYLGLFAIGQLGPDGSDAIPAVVRCLRDRDEVVREMAIQVHVGRRRRHRRCRRRR